MATGESIAHMNCLIARGRAVSHTDRSRRRLVPPGRPRTRDARRVRSHAVQNHTLTTIAEESGFRRTGRTDEVTRLCAAFAAAWPRAVQSLEFGRSAQGRPMRALLVSRADPRRVPVLMLQAGIHPGESDGKDAGFIALRELLGESTAPRGTGAHRDPVRARLQRRRPRALRPLEPAQPGRARGDRLAHHGAEPQSQPRLRQGGLAGDARTARAGARLGPAGVRRPARHRRRQLPAGRVAAVRAGQPGRSATVCRRTRAARRGDREPGSLRLDAPALLSRFRAVPTTRPPVLC